MSQILTWLDGKKMVIAGCVAVVVGYLAKTGVIDTDLSTAILAIMNILFGGAVVATNQVLGKRNSMGARSKY
jgi:hypothetical protein